MSPPAPGGHDRGPRGWAAVTGYFRALWSGTEPLHRVIISDMLIGGTLVNLTTFAVSLVLFGLEAPKWLGAIVFLSPIPYSVFVVVAVWRTAAVSNSPLAWPARLGAMVWLGAMLLI